MDCVGCDKCKLWGKLQVGTQFIHHCRLFSLRRDLERVYTARHTEYYTETCCFLLLQVRGMGTALKILFSGENMGPQSILTDDSKSDFRLNRVEVVSLFNAFGR